MNRSFQFVTNLALSSALFALSLSSCAGEQPAVNRVGVNVVDKSLFNGSWYFSRVVIDVDYEAAGGLGTYPGDSAIDFSGIPSITSLPRVRWVIDEDFLLAYRDYEFIEGISREDATPGEWLGHPVAAFKIEKHFDIRRDYNTVTGEERNVLIENDVDRRWYERQYMRVNWSMNELPGYYGQTADLYEVLGLYIRAPSTIFIQGQSDFPDSWAPRFDFMQCSSLEDSAEGCLEEERDWAEDYQQGDLYHFSFVTQEMLVPSWIDDPFQGTVNFCQSVYADAPICTTIASYVRNAFLKVSDERQYIASNWVDTRQNRHGYFRNERPTYDRSLNADDPRFGRTDFLNYNANRQNMWREWYNEETGEPLPYNERRVRQQIWYTTPELPAHLVEPSMDLVSRWNEVFMRNARVLQNRPLPQYERVACQTENPDGYCYCTTDPETGENLFNDCPGGYDPFDAANRGAVADGYDCHVEVPEGAQPDLNNPTLSDEMFYGWYGARFVGDECAVVLRMNSCNRQSIADNGGTTEGMHCQERGDMRFKFLSYVNQPGTGFLGVATLRGDPVSGEIMAGDANIGGPALDGYRTRALQMYDLVNGDVDDRTFLIGEDVRGYLENLDRTQLPNAPREPFLVANRIGAGGDALTRQEVNNRFDSFLNRVEGLQGQEGQSNIFGPQRRAALVGTALERRLFANPDMMFAAGVQRLPDGVGPSDVNDHILDQVSPFRVPAGDILAYHHDRDTKLSKANVMMPNEYTDASVMEFVTRHRDWSRARLEIGLNQLLYYQTQLHEMGHCMGLRHQFGASADTENYDDDYYYINDQFPYPDPADYEEDGTAGFSPAEQRNWEDAYERIKELRELAGADRWMNSSIMEYTGQWYERTVTGARGAGRYDHAAIGNAYGDTTELYDNRNSRATLQDLNPTTTPRIWVKFYNGGETCQSDADCPFSTEGPQSSLLLDGNLQAGLTQTCVADPTRRTQNRICSNYDDDAAAMVAGAEPTAAPDFVPVNYRFCSDERVGTYAWCHRFDEGDNYREIVRNIAEDYDRNYLFRYFRRYRRNFATFSPLQTLIGRQYNILSSVFANLMHEYVSNPEYRETNGAFGFDDHFFATADILNFYGKVLASPGIGSYQFDEGWQRYRRRGLDPDISGAQLSVPLGMGRYSFSEYQDGLTGIRRVELVGSFYDKIVTMQMMVQRGAYNWLNPDRVFLGSLFDLFPVEMQQIFQGMILNQPEQLSPRLECGGGTFPTCTDPRLVYLDFYRGDCTDPRTCRQPPSERFGDMPVVDAGVAFTLQFLGAIYALQEIPIFYDTSFQNQVFVCIQGEGNCRDIAPGEVEGRDYVTFASERYGKTFIAWQVEPTENVPNQTSMGFAMVSETKEFEELLGILRRYRGDFGGTALSTANLSTDDTAYLDRIEYRLATDANRLNDEVDRVFGRIQSNESFFFQLIQLFRTFGI